VNGGADPGLAQESGPKDFVVQHRGQGYLENNVLVADGVAGQFQGGVAAAIQRAAKQETIPILPVARRASYRQPQKCRCHFIEARVRRPENVDHDRCRGGGAGLVGDRCDDQAGGFVGCWRRRKHIGKPCRRRGGKAAFAQDEIAVGRFAGVFEIIHLQLGVAADRPRQQAGSVGGRMHMIRRQRRELAAASAIDASVADMDDPDAPADKDERRQRSRQGVLGIGAGPAEHPGVGTSQRKPGGTPRAKRGRRAKVTFQQAVQRDMCRFARAGPGADAARDGGNDTAARPVEGFAFRDDIHIRGLGCCGSRRRCSDRQRPSRSIER
jgi:hypothetical protein